MKYIPFNLNSYVKVKLTDLGYQWLADRHNYNMGFGFPGSKATAQDFKNKADSEGYSRFQMHVFIERFGIIMTVGADRYVNSNILIEIKD